MVSSGRSGLPPASLPLGSCVAGRYSSPTFSAPNMVLPSGLPVSFSRAPAATPGRLVRTHVHEPFYPSISFVGAAPARLWLGLCRTAALVRGAIAGRIHQWFPPARRVAARCGTSGVYRDTRGVPGRDGHPSPPAVSGSSSPPDRQTVGGKLWSWSWLCQTADTPLLSHQSRSYGPGLSAASLALRNGRICRSRCSDCRVEFPLVAPPSPSPLAGRAGQSGGSASGPAAFCSVPPGRRRSGTPDASPLRPPAAGASKTVGVPAPMSSPLPGDHPSDGCGRLAGLPGCFFGEPIAAPFLLHYPVVPTHDTGFRPAASAGPVVTRGFGTCDSPPVVLGDSLSSPTTPEFVGAPGQLFKICILRRLDITAVYTSNISIAPVHAEFSAIRGLKHCVLIEKLTEDHQY
ncbi:hypothetical protein T10_10450 [Trichinella papuae]|uniref:Uncharacterized protein n=1 Tax=Trichinella papuae TaxID=268474 RepID=A0A0V1MG09_9BILA|nr:hypothetical protein T10_10450 [Trichinella papuae]